MAVPDQSELQMKQAQEHRQLVKTPKPPAQRVTAAMPDLIDRSPRGEQLRTTAQFMQNSPPANRLGSLDATMAGLGQATAQRMAAPEEEPLQRKAETAPPPNRTGLPDRLKSGTEALSGLSMDHVRVHYNSPRPAQLNALAYAQGSDIHLGPGQEQHLPHEA
ncbi:MAG: hypothetical protein RL490_2642, partial [Pseudomonadota bacterium]